MQKSTQHPSLQLEVRLDQLFRFDRYRRGFESAPVELRNPARRKFMSG
jgi:hypothetical protein